MSSLSTVRAVPGVSWSVTIGEHKHVESVSGTWAVPVDAGDYALRSTENVFDDLRNGKAQYIGPQPLVANDTPALAPDSSTLPTVAVHITGVAARPRAVGGSRERGSPSPTSFRRIASTPASPTARSTTSRCSRSIPPALRWWPRRQRATASSHDPRPRLSRLPLRHRTRIRRAPTSIRTRDLPHVAHLVHQNGFRD